jgi:hypothetical protein
LARLCYGDLPELHLKNELPHERGLSFDGTFVLAGFARESLTWHPVCTTRRSRIMKPFVRNIMFTGVLAMAASSMAVAQTSSSWFEQWHRAKYGRPAPTEQARLAAYEENTAYRAETPNQVTEPVNTWFEGWYRAKYGRPSPQEEARIQVNCRIWRTVKRRPFRSKHPETVGTRAGIARNSDVHRP